MEKKKDDMRKEKIIKDDGRYLIFYYFKEGSQKDNVIKGGKGKQSCPN